MLHIYKYIIINIQFLVIALYAKQKKKTKKTDFENRINKLEIRINKKKLLSNAEQL